MMKTERRGNYGMTLGSKLKTLREMKGYTLKQTAEISGLSIGFISQVERGQTDPSLSSLKKLSGALGVKLGDLFEQDSAVHVLVKKGEGNILHINSSVYCELLAASFNKTMEPMIKFIAPGGESGLVDHHTGEEFIWVIEGDLQMTLGNTVYMLHSGDSVFFQANQIHAWKNVGTGLCRALWITSPPCYS